MNETKRSGFKKHAAAIAVASCVTFVPLGAEAAGLGKLTVLSGLGQPLRAELEVGASKEELAGMTARLATQDAFKQAGVDFSSVLLDLRFAVERRANGQSVIKVTSGKPINEPFLDFLVELNWPAGRLVREYTFLLDPPEIAARQTERQVADARVVETVRGRAATDDVPAIAPARKPVRVAQAPKAPAEPKVKPESTGTRVVQSGDTLRKIALETKPEGVSLEQMLVGLFQNNPDAFIGQNVNRLRAGAILNVPDQASVAAISPVEAKKIYVAQSGDWNAYRQKLAGVTAKGAAKPDEGGAQSSGGKISAKVEEKVAPAAQSKDQVKVAKTDVPAKQASAVAAVDAAEQVAKDRALKEAQERLASLEKNVADLQKLVEVKNQKLAELQQPVPKKEEPKAVEAVKPVEAPKPVVPPVEVPKVEVAKPVEPPKMEEPAKAPESVKPAEVKPAEVKPPAPPAEKPKVIAPPPVVEEPGFVDTLLEDPLPLAGGGGILALLAGYLFLKRRRGNTSTMETTAAPMPSSLGPNSVFRMTGGQSVDTANTPPQTGEFSQTGPGTIDTDEVDPVAEADVYMAYGRDTQAEEILLEALQKDPHRTAIHAKLLEIYAGRRSVKQFETLAGELYAQTGGMGAEWEKVAAMGQSIDPGNPLYSASKVPAQAVTESVPELPLPEEDVGTPVPDVSGFATQGVSEIKAEEFSGNTVVLPEESPQEATPVFNLDVEADASGEDVMTLDFDLDSPARASASPDATLVADLDDLPSAMEDAPSAPLDNVTDTMTATAVSVDPNALDFDLGMDDVPPSQVATQLVDDGMLAADNAVVDAIDFDLGGTTPAAPVDSEPAMDEVATFSPEGTLVLPSAAAAATLDEELDVGQGTWVGGEPEAAAVELPAADDVAVFDLDALPPSMASTSVNALSGMETVATTNVLDFGQGISDDDPKLADTMVNSGVVDTDALEFDVKLTDSMILGQPMETPEFDMGSINLDLAAEPPVSVVEAPPAASQATDDLPDFAAPKGEVASAAHDAQWEEVNTKLDLAKAYEEMGDIEGARELLQEVAAEGPVDLVEQARSMLERIGG